MKITKKVRNGRDTQLHRRSRWNIFISEYPSLMELYDHQDHWTQHVEWGVFEQAKINPLGWFENAYDSQAQ